MRKTRPTAAAAEIYPQPGNDNSPIVMLTTAQLRELMHETVLRALDEYRQGEQPEKATLSGDELSRRIGVSRSKVHHLRHAGMPALKVGETYRFELKACLAWLRERGNVSG